MTSFSDTRSTGPTPQPQFLKERKSDRLPSKPASWLLLGTWRRSRLVCRSCQASFERHCKPHQVWRLSFRSDRDGLCLVDLYDCRLGQLGCSEREVLLTLVPLRACSLLRLA